MATSLTDRAANYSYLPMASSIKSILNVLVIVFVCVWLLQASGLWNGVSTFRLQVGEVSFIGERVVWTRRAVLNSPRPDRDRLRSRGQSRLAASPNPLRWFWWRWAG
jgi:hypothetical protein